MLVVVDKETDPKFRKSSDTIWFCQCECGGFRHVTTYNLISGRVRSCGCGKKTNAKDLTGKRFGKLTASHPHRNERGKRAWMCECDCGGLKVIQACHLLSGKQTDCGCGRKKAKCP